MAGPRAIEGIPSAPLVELRILDENGDEFTGPVVINQSLSQQFTAKIFRQDTDEVLEEDPALVWWEDSIFFNTTVDGLVTVAATAPVGNDILIRADGTWAGHSITAELLVEIGQGIDPAPGTNSVNVAFGNGQTTAVNAELPAKVIVRVLDNLGAPVPGNLISFTPSHGGSVVGGTFVTGALGFADGIRWVLGPTAGLQTLRIREKFGSFVEVTATAVAAPAVRVIQHVSGGGQSGDVNTELPDPLVIRVENGAGVPVAGADVIWTPPAGGSISDEDLLTDANGLAQATVTLGPTPGPQPVEVETTDGDGDTEVITMFGVSVGVDENLVPSGAARAFIGPIVLRSASAPPNQLWENNHDVWFPRMWSGTPRAYLTLEGGAGALWLNHVHYGPGRQEFAMRMGQVIGAAATNETTQYWAQQRRINDYNLNNYIATGGGFAPQAHWNTGDYHQFVHHVLEPTNVNAAKRRKYLWVSAARFTSNSFGYQSGTNPNAGTRLPGQAFREFIMAILMGLPYTAHPGGPNRGFDPAPGSWQAAFARQYQWVLTWPGFDVNTGYWGSTSNQGFEQYYFNVLAAETLLIYDAFIASTANYRALARLIIEHVVDLWLDVQKPQGKPCMPYARPNEAGARELTGYYIRPMLMLWQDYEGSFASPEAQDSTFAARCLQFVVDHLKGATPQIFDSGTYEKRFNQTYHSGGHVAQAAGPVHRVSWRQS